MQLCRKYCLIYLEMLFLLSSCYVGWQSDLTIIRRVQFLNSEVIQVYVSHQDLQMHSIAETAFLQEKM